jgi:hypothetical protein
LTCVRRYVKLAPKIRINWSVRLTVDPESAASVKAFWEELIKVRRQGR